MDQTKIVILPSGIESFKLVDLPYANGSKKFVFANEKLYELRQVNGTNPHKPSNAPKYRNEPVKSFIIEGKDQGQVIQNSSVTVSSKFNFLYYLIHVTFTNKDKFSKFVTYEDLLDNLQSVYSNANWTETLESLIRSNIKKIFEEINENDETFYKLSVSKILKTMNNKINELFAFCKSHQDTLSIIRTLKLTLYQDVMNNDIPSDILDLAILNHSINLLFNSYLPAELKQSFIQFNKLDFTKLNSYIQTLNDRKKSLQVIETNNIVPPTNSKVKKPVAKKKVTKKVAVGKGKLDSFFKRQ